MNNKFTHKFVLKPISLFSVMATMAMILSACMASATPVQTPFVTLPVSNPTAVTSTAPTIDVATDPTLGRILVDGKGMTLYVFTKDAPDQSNCDAKCQANWPPLVASSTPKLGAGVDASLIGTAALADGAKIITYDHMPLYYFIKDTQAGQTSGEDVGTVWFVVSPDGKPVKPAGTSAPTATPAAVVTVPTINVATDPTLGKILANGKGMTLYVFSKDGLDQSNCDAKCQANWPPLLTQGNPILGPGVDGSLIGSAMLADGTKIVTYNHMPLYNFIKDTKPGETNGQGVGSVWYVISPDGKIIGK